MDNIKEMLKHIDWLLKSTDRSIADFSVIRTACRNMHEHETVWFVEGYSKGYYPLTTYVILNEDLVYLTLKYEFTRYCSLEGYKCSLEDIKQHNIMYGSRYIIMICTKGGRRYDREMSN